MKPLVLFVCVHNAGRSQIAAALLSSIAGDRIEVRSAGSTPADAVRPSVVAAMDELGIDLRSEQPKRLEAEDVRRADVVVTMGCGDSCPVFPGVRYEDWEVPDPTDRPIEEVRRLRDDLAGRVRALAAELLDREDDAPAR